MDPRRERRPAGTAHLPLARALRNLHQALMRAEAAGDESLANPYALLAALMNDPRFAWLRALSELMAEIDQQAADGMMHATAELTPWRAAVERLIGPAAPDRPDFRERYDELRRDVPAVDVAAAAVREELAKIPSGEPDLLH